MSAHATWILGWIVLSPAAIISAWAIWSTLKPKWRRIWSLARGRYVSPAASVVTPLRPRLSSLDVVEADVELARAALQRATEASS